MHKNWPELAAGLSPALKELRAGAPDVMKGFSALARAALEAKALDRKTKELIALAISVAIALRRLRRVPRRSGGAARRHARRGDGDDGHGDLHGRRPVGDVRRAGARGVRPVPRDPAGQGRLIRRPGPPDRPQGSRTRGRSHARDAEGGNASGRSGGAADLPGVAVVRVTKRAPDGCGVGGLIRENAVCTGGAVGSGFKGLIWGNADLGFCAGGAVGSGFKGLIELNRLGNEVRSLVM